MIGALIADRLGRTTLSTVLVDKGAVGAGSTSARTALLMYQLDLGLAELGARIGMRKAVRAYRLSRRAVRTLKTLAGTLGLASRCRAKKVLYVASHPSHVAALREEHAALREHGFAVRLVERPKLTADFTIDKPAALVVNEAAEIDPVALTQALVRRARAARVLERKTPDLSLFAFDR